MLTIVPTGLAALVAGGAVVDFALSPDGTRAVYRADQEVDGRIDLYSVNLVGAPASVRLSRVLGPGNGVHAYRIAPDGQRVLGFQRHEQRKPRGPFHQCAQRRGVGVADSKSPSQCPGTVRFVTSAGRSSILTRSCPTGLEQSRTLCGRRNR